MYQPKTISSKEMVEDGAYPVFGANGIIGKYDKYNHIEPQLLITCRGATCGSVNISEPNSWINGNAMVVKPKDDSFDLKFLEYLFRGGIDLSKIITGAAQPQITRQSLNPVIVSYPKSLSEQQRIVAILDEAFAAIAKAKANAEQNLKNAKELFESYLQGVFEKKGEGWETKTVQEITKVINGYAFSSNDFQSTNSIKSVKITNVGVKEFVEESENYLPEKFRDTLKEFQVREGDIVIALTRTIISAGLKVAVIPKSYDGALINQRVAAMTPKEKLVNQEFLYFFLCSKAVEKYVLEHVNTLMQPNLSINDLKNMPVNLPSLQEQKTIIRQLDALRAETQKLEAVYQQKLADLEELKKSILQKAFAGELTDKSIAS
uniref:restriction endonuclease subunit S n=1 Tax=Algoriphagus sp. TaxID=1872435 RepID=UPI00404852DB